MDLSAFLADTSIGAGPTNWADDVADLPTGPKMRDSSEMGSTRFAGPSPFAPLL